MARKKLDQNFQLEVEDDEAWNKLLEKEGLIVAESYATWCGPCNGMNNTLKKTKLEMGDDSKLLNFAHAKANCVTALHDYSGSCEPCFLFYAGKQLVQVVRGANAPVIIAAINQQLAHEKKVMAGEAERKPIVDTFLAEKKEADAKIKESEASSATNGNENDLLKSDKEITVCIIKPDMIAAEKQEEITEKIKERGYTILEQKMVTFTDEMAREFYAHKKESEKFDELITYMTSGVSCVLALTKEKGTGDETASDEVSPINDWRRDLDDKEVSLRAQYATNELMNGLHGSDSHEAAVNELAFFFSSNKNSESDGGKNGSSGDGKQQKTIALIRPTAFSANKDQILQRIKDSGFEIAHARTIQFDEAQAAEFYADQKDQPFFNDLCKEMSSGPMMVLCLVKDNAVDSFRELLGPKEKELVKEAAGTLRNEFDVESSPVNAMHASSSAEQAAKQIEMFFPVEQTVAIIKPGVSDEKRAEIEKKIEQSGFIVQSKKSEKLSEDIAKEIYKNSEDKPYHDDLIKMMTSGETNIYVLSRENAIEGWRDVIGDVDPATAKQKNQESLRSIYGVDILNNGVHGPSNKEQAEHEIKLLFGDDRK